MDKMSKWKMIRLKDTRTVLKEISDPEHERTVNLLKSKISMLTDKLSSMEREIKNKDIEILKIKESYTKKNLEFIEADEKNQSLQDLINTLQVNLKFAIDEKAIKEKKIVKVYKTDRRLIDRELNMYKKELENRLRKKIPKDIIRSILPIL